MHRDILAGRFEAGGAARSSGNFCIGPGMHTPRGGECSTASKQNAAILWNSCWVERWKQICSCCTADATSARDHSASGPPCIKAKPRAFVKKCCGCGGLQPAERKGERERNVTSLRGLFSFQWAVVRAKSCDASPPRRLWPLDSARPQCDGTDFLDATSDDS